MQIIHWSLGTWLIVGSKTSCVTWALLQTLEGIAGVPDGCFPHRETYSGLLSFHLAQLVSAELDS